MVAILAILAKWLVFRHFLGGLLARVARMSTIFPYIARGAHHRTLMPA